MSAQYLFRKALSCAPKSKLRSRLAIRTMRDFGDDYGLGFRANLWRGHALVLLIGIRRRDTVASRLRRPVGIARCRLLLLAAGFQRSEFDFLAGVLAKESAAW
jgi:hypothetical protein